MNQPSFLLEHRYRREHPLWTLLQLCRDDRGRLLRAAFFHIIKHSPVWVLPLVTANVIDILAHPEAHARRELWLNLGVLLPVILQNIPMHIAYVRQLSVATRNIEMNLRVAICRRLQELSIGFYTRSSTGALQAKLLRDVESVQLLLTNVFDSILSLGMVILAALVAVAVRLPWFLVFFALTVPIVVLLVRALRRPIQDRNTAFRREIEGLSSRLIEMTQLIPITRALGEEEHELERVQDSLERVRLSGIRLDTINASFGAASWVSLQLFSGLVLGLSAWLYLSRWLPVTVGDVVLLTSYAGQLTNSVLGLVNLAPTVSRGLESIRSIGEILECPDLEENQGKAEVRQVTGRITFEHVSFNYPDTDEACLRDFSLDIRPGEKIAIVGPSGAGKSTLINLAIGFLRPSQGRILLDGRDMAELDMRTYRRFISLVPQETVLFDGTVCENVTYGAPQADEAQVRAVLQDANALEFVEQLPEGLDTVVGERGARLSGGQKQRLAIARALIRDPRLLVLDEATSALDSISEALIQQALAGLMRGRTTLVVAHRLSTVRSADRIVVMEAGRIVEAGSHAELLERQGAYYHLQALQV